jgi:hypothetical protein
VVNETKNRWFVDGGVFGTDGGLCGGITGYTRG